MDTRNIIRLDTTESTNSVALEAGRQGAASGTVIVAETQTGGRGRLKRSWLSLPGLGLYFSIILRPELAPQHLAKITLAAGVAVCQAIERKLGLKPQIKWPNDILLDDKKVGGILSETGPIEQTSAGQQTLVVVGIGLNIKEPAGGFPPDLKEKATALSGYLDKAVAREELVLPIADALDREVALLEKGDFSKILKEWMQRDASHGKVLTWVTPQGEKVTGLSLGPDPEGVLRIRDQAGTIHIVLSGDVSLVGKIPE